MKSFIIKGPEGYGICTLCPLTRRKSCHPTKDKCEIATENIYVHILTNQHEIKTSKGDKEKLEKLKDAINQAKLKKQQKKNNPNDENNKKHYLEFVSFALKENLSFAQISSIGKYLQAMALGKNIDFLMPFF